MASKEIEKEGKELKEIENDVNNNLTEIKQDEEKKKEDNNNNNVVNNNNNNGDEGKIQNKTNEEKNKSPPSSPNNDTTTAKLPTEDSDEGLSLDKTITRFRFQYDKLHRSLARSMETERRLVNETKNLRLKLVDNSKKIELAYKWKSEDQKTIKLLRRELNKAWETAEVFRQKELRAQELITTLKDEIISLSEHAHASFNRSASTAMTESLVSSSKSMNIGNMNNPDSPLKPIRSLIKRTGIKNNGIPNFEEWKKRNRIHTPTAGTHRKTGPADILRRPRTTPIKRRPRTPLEFAKERS